MRGETVIIHCFRGNPAVARVWEADKKVVYVLTREGFSRLQESGEGPIPAGFLRKDVFKYRTDLDDEVASGQIDWSKLEPWKG